jgi:hypothetical protein
LCIIFKISSLAHIYKLLAKSLQAAGDERAALALDMFVYRVRKYIGAYSAALSGRVDALVFSAGIGENSSIIRGLICKDMQVRVINKVTCSDSLLEAVCKNKAIVGGVQGDISALSQSNCCCCCRLWACRLMTARTRPQWVVFRVTSAPLTAACAF